VSDDSVEKTGPYERAVQWITERVKPYLHGVTERFVKKSVDKYAKGNEHYARMIEFEVRRRGDGAGLTQDVAEPLVWIGAKSALAMGIEVVMRPFRNNEKFQWKWIGHAAAFSIIAQQAVELFRVLPRYKAGLQGSLEMAKDRWHSLEETGIDPFNSQTREIARQATNSAAEEIKAERTTAGFYQSIPNNAMTPAAVLESKGTSTEVAKA